MRDARVVPALITSSSPGDLVVERNPGNIVAIYSDECVGVSASIEYAVSVLQVPDVIICGHTDCGAVRAMLHHTRTESIPAVSRWLMYGQAAVEQLMKRQPNESDEEE